VPGSSFRDFAIPLDVCGQITSSTILQHKVYPIWSLAISTPESQPMNTIHTNNLAYRILAKQKTAPYDLLNKHTAKRTMKTIQVEIKSEL
jgi:hypothetical protein